MKPSAALHTHRKAIRRVVVSHRASNPRVFGSVLHLPWRNIRGMRNRIAHGYFDINLDVVWDTVQTALPGLLMQLQAMDPE
jgi:uncharacterized protein with HEPN domain